MELYQINILEVIIKGIPEGLLFVYSVFVFTKTRFLIKQYLLMVLIFTLFVITIKLLPIGPGANSMLYIIFLIALMITTGKVPIQKAFVAVLATAILIGVSEFFNVVLLNSLYGKEQTVSLIGDPATKTICGIPSTLIFAFSLLILRIGIYRDKLLVKKDGTASKENRKNDFDESSL